MNVRATTRRRFLTAAAASAYSLYGADDRVKIASVKAYPIRVAGMAGGAVPKFTSDFDPARSRWIGPFSQLGGALLVEIQIVQGLTGYRMFGGDGVAAYLIESLLGPPITPVSTSTTRSSWASARSNIRFATTSTRVARA